MTPGRDRNRRIDEDPDDRGTPPRYTGRGPKYLPRSGLLEPGAAADPGRHGPTRDVSSHQTDLFETVPRREKPDLDLPAATRTAEVMTRPGLPGGRWSGIGTPLCGQRIKLRSPPPERRSAARLRASVGSTEALDGRLARFGRRNDE